METEHTILWILGLLMGMQFVVVITAMYVYHHLEPCMRKAWPFLVAAWSIIIVRRILGTVRWGQLYNMVLYENLLLIVISLLNLLFLYTVLVNCRNKKEVK